MCGNVFQILAPLERDSIQAGLRMDILANFEASGVVDFFILILYYVASGEIAVFQSDEEGKVF